MTSEKDSAVDVLMKEYAALKSEILVQVGLYNQQSRLIQLYGGLLFGVSAAYLSFLKLTTSIEGDKPITLAVDVTQGIAAIAFWFIILLLAASIAFYIVSSVMSYAYMFKILRMRMASIETQVNKDIGRPVTLTYESEIVPYFLEQKRYAPRSFTPYALSGFWRLITLALFVFVLIILGFILLPKIIAVIYSTFILISMVFHVQQYMSLFRGAGNMAITKYFERYDWKSIDEN